MNIDCSLQCNAVRSTGRLALRPGVVSSGFDELDAELPGGGWPRGALTEILTTEQDVRALRFLMPALSRLSQDEDRWICWVAPPWVPCASTFLGMGLDLSRVLLVHPRTPRDSLLAIEQSLRSGTCSAVLAWSMIDDGAVLERLRSAAEDGNALGFLFRQQGLAEQDAPAALRLRLQ